MTAKVYLTGAGPGDPALLTLKAKKALENADVILYDRLANKSFLDYAGSEAEIIYVGKKAKNHRYSQSEIQELMLKKAEAGKTVCRLKGGDPFIYGRGGEEALVLEKAGIDFEIIPGISSSLAVPLYAGIPLTQRHLASSFAVITGHEAADKAESSIEIEKIAAAVDTLVVLMGVGNLDKIVSRVTAAGKSLDTKVALIRWGSRSEQKTISGNLANIVEKVEKANFKPPAVIVIGEVVNLRNKLKWFEKKSLFGKNILITRPSKQAASLAKMIEEEAGKPILAPAIKIKAARDKSLLKKAFQDLSSYDYLIFTSVNGVKYFMESLAESNLDLRALAGTKIIAIGAKTAASLKDNGIRADLMPEDYSTAGILNQLQKLAAKGIIEIKNSNFLLPRSNIAPAELQEGLKELGAVVNNITAYRTEGLEIKAEIIDLIIKGELNLLTFTSSSTVENLINGIKKTIMNNQAKNQKDKKNNIDLIFKKLRKIPAACIGPVTAQKARKKGLNVKVVASEYTIEGLFSAILNYYLAKEKN